MGTRESLLRDLREDIKKHRDLMKTHKDEDIRAMGVALDSFLLVSYDPQALADLCLVLTYFINEHLGGEN